MPEKNHSKNMRFKKIFFFLLLFILGWFYTPGFLKLRKCSLSLHRYEKEIKELKIKNKELEKEKELLENDLFTIEKLGRNELDLVKEGEIVYKIR